MTINTLNKYICMGDAFCWANMLRFCFLSLSHKTWVRQEGGSQRETGSLIRGKGDDVGSEQLPLTHLHPLGGVEHPKRYKRVNTQTDGIKQQFTNQMDSPPRVFSVHLFWCLPLPIPCLSTGLLTKSRTFLTCPLRIQFSGSRSKKVTLIERLSPQEFSLGSNPDEAV